MGGLGASTRDMGAAHRAPGHGKHRLWTLQASLPVARGARIRARDRGSHTDWLPAAARWARAHQLTSADAPEPRPAGAARAVRHWHLSGRGLLPGIPDSCLLYTSDAADDLLCVD